MKLTRGSSLPGGNRRATGNLEYAFLYGDVCVAVGWSSLENMESGTWPTLNVYRFPRPDANRLVDLPEDYESGFVALSTGEGANTNEALVASVRKALLAMGVDGRPGGLADFTAGGDYSVGLLAGAVSRLPDGVDKARFAGLWDLLRLHQVERGDSDPSADSGPLLHIDHCLRVDASDLLVLSGWTSRSATIAALDLVPGQGSRDARLVLNVRPDVTSAAGPNYSGFVATIAGDVGVGGAVRVRATDGDRLTEMNVQVSSIKSSDPVEVVRELFQIATHPRDFMERLDNGEGDAIVELILDRNADEGRRAFTVQRMHDQADIDVSVIIPLFRRYDLLWNQFLAWSQCSRPDRIELVLVNDDPRHDVDCTELVDQLVGVFGLNVTLLANRVNRGYAASNNVGAKMAKGSTLLLLNSDAFLDDAESVFAGEALLAERADVGLVGALIHDADGLVIHQGLACTYLESRSSWFNYHPAIGFPMDPHVSDRTTVVDGVTGAVVMARRREFLDLGGFAEDFLVGDYEDSDLCWRVNESGKSVVILDALRAVHSERTSMSLVGGDELRERISLFNTWLHARRWRPFLQARFGGPVEVQP